MTHQAKASQQLQDAFEQFNELSEQLYESYQVLQDRVASLTRELYAARSERLRQLAEKERLAERLAALLDALPGGVVVLDSESVVSECNPAAEDIMGKKLNGVPWQRLVPEGTPACSDAHELVLENGRVVNISSRALELNGGCILLLQDVTEMCALQDHVKRQERLSAMGEMMARLSHQVRTPLATAMLYASHLNRANLSHEQKRTSISQLQQGLQHLDQMINDMLVFSRGGRGGDTSLSVTDLIEQVRNALAPQLQALGAVWRVSPVDKTIQVTGNRVSLTGVLTNLAVNALFACGEGAQLLWRVDQASDVVRIVLNDNGPGIAASDATQIFEPFYTTRSHGTGLGLAVVQAVVEAHEGSVNLDTGYTNGASFVVCLPAAASQRAEIQSREAPLDECRKQLRSA